MVDMRQAEAFRAEVERLKPLIKSGEPFYSEMPEAVAQARGEVIHELLKRPSLTLSQIDWLEGVIEVCRSRVGTLYDQHETVEVLRAMRAELMSEKTPEFSRVDLTKEDDGVGA